MCVCGVLKELNTFAKPSEPRWKDELAKVFQKKAGAFSGDWGRTWVCKPSVPRTAARRWPPMQT